MLKLTTKDLGIPVMGGKPGVYVWWTKRPGGKRALLCVSWSGLVLINPKIEWPSDLREERINGWGIEGRTFRISMVKGWIPAPVIRADVPVPDLEPALLVTKVDTALLHYQGATGRIIKGIHRFGRLAGPEECVYLVGMKTIRRIAAALGMQFRQLELRLLDPPWAPGSLVVFCYRGPRLRAIASTITEESLGGDI